MSLDPQAKFFLDQLEAQQTSSVHELSVAENRELIANFIPLSGEAQYVSKLENRMIPVENGEIAIRIYTPEGKGPFPVFLYFHGGGFVIGDLEVVDSPLRALTNASRCIVVSVDYRKAPEYPFPTAPEDCYTATKWVSEHISAFNGDPDNIAVGGDSAGGNLAAVVSLMARDRGGPLITYQVLIYPTTDLMNETESRRINGNGYLLTNKDIEWFITHYLTEKERANPYASPLLAENLSNLPPTLIITAEYDPLRDEGEAFAERLRFAGVPIELTRYNGMIHGFFWLSGIIDKGKEAIDQIAESLRNTFYFETKV